MDLEVMDLEVMDLEVMDLEVTERESAAGKRIVVAAAKALGGAAHLASEQGDSAAAQAMYEESVALQRQTGDYSSIGWALTGLGRMALIEGDLARSRGFMRRGPGVPASGRKTYGASLTPLSAWAF